MKTAVKRPRRAYPEGEVQQGLVPYLRAAIIAPARFWFCPNGVNIPRGTHGIYQAMGLTSGVHDLHFIWPGGYGTIEMKAPNAKKDATTNEQKQFGADMLACGHQWAEARSLDEVLAILTSWGVPLRAPREAVRYAFANGIKIKSAPVGLF